MNIDRDFSSNDLLNIHIILFIQFKITRKTLTFIASSSKKPIKIFTCS